MSLSNRILSRARTFHSDERGVLSVLSLLAMLGFVLLIGGLFNCVIVVQDKLELQGAADAAAQSAGTQMARGLNAVTTINHVIGELQALIVLHDALAGDGHSTGKKASDNHAQSVLQQAHNSAVSESWGTFPPVGFDSVAEPATFAAAMGDSYRQLRSVMTYAYRIHAVGAFLQMKGGRIPFVGQLCYIWGETLVISAMTIEAKVWMEAETLSAMNSFMYTPLLPARRSAEGLVWALNAVSIAQVVDAPIQTESVAQAIAKDHGTKGSLFPGLTTNPSLPLLQLPVHSESGTLSQNDLPKSQLVRACVPWVHYWRLPFLDFGDAALKLSRFKSYYVHWTQQSLLTQASLAKKRGVNLFILKDFDPAKMTKGSEPWVSAEGSRKCDDRFAVVAFTHRSSPMRMGPVYFAAPNAKGIASFAQTLAYNANPQLPGTAGDGWQEIVGWDTLNWVGTPVPEWSQGIDPDPHGNTRTDYFRDRSPAPAIRLNWQSMLVPSTRISESVLWQKGDLGDIMRRTDVDTRAARTH